MACYHQVEVLVLKAYGGRIIVEMAVCNEDSETLEFAGYGTLPNNFFHQ